MPKKQTYLPDFSSTNRAKKPAGKAKPAPAPTKTAPAKKAPTSSLGGGGKASKAAGAKPAAKAKPGPARVAKPAAAAKKAAPKSSLGAGGKASKAAAAKPAPAPVAAPKTAPTPAANPAATRAARRPAPAAPPQPPEPVAAAAEPLAAAPTPAPAAPPAAKPVVRYVEVPPPPAPPSRRQINEALVLAVLAARREDDLGALRRVLADDVALHLPAEVPIVGRDNLLAEWDRQADLLEDVAAFEADLRSVAAGDDHAFTYVETRTEAKGTPISYTTLTAYRIRNGQVVEIRQHVDDLMGYLSFWRELAAAGPEAGDEVEEEEEEEAPPRPKGFARFFR